MGWVAKTFVGIGIGVAFLLLFGAVVAYTALQEAKPIMEREYPTQLFSQERTCAPCAEASATEVFTVSDSMNRVNARFVIAHEAAGGTFRITVTDPSGDVRYDRTFTGGTSEQSAVDEPVWSPETGDWRITRAYTAYRGSIALDIWGSGVPPGTF